MTQSPTFNFQNPPWPGSTALPAINLMIRAILDANAGAVAPPNPVAHMFWRDTSVTPNVLRVRNAANSAWVTFLADLGVALTAAQINGAGQLAGRNRIINGQGRINQRGYVSGAATTIANQYTLDRWRVVTLGQSLAFTGTDAGRTMTAPAGGCEQVIEGANIEGGTYVLNWTGTATATVNGTARAKGATFTLPANTNAIVRLIGGTFTDVQLELGGLATPFERFDIGRELFNCRRYFEVMGDGVAGHPNFVGYQLGGTAAALPVQFSVPKRAIPSLARAGTWFVSNCSQPTVQNPSRDGFTISVVATIAGAFQTTANSPDDFITADAEL